MRSSARKHSANTTVKSRLKTLERNYLEALKAGKKDAAKKELETLAKLGARFPQQAEVAKLIQSL